MVQASLTSCILGIAFGQIIMGALSDVHGRRRPLLISMIVYSLSSFACAFARNVTVFINFRFMKKSVLVIDDDVDMCALLSRFLGKHGYVVDTAHSSSKGIEKFKAGTFDVVISYFRLCERKYGKDVLL